MKKISIFLCMLSFACHTPAPSSTTKVDPGNKSDSDIKKLAFNTGSRGYQKEIKLTQDSVILNINSAFEERPSRTIHTSISSDEWKSIVNSLDHVNIRQLPELPSFSMKRAVDAADHSS